MRSASRAEADPRRAKKETTRSASGGGGEPRGAYTLQEAGATQALGDEKTSGRLVPHEAAPVPASVEGEEAEGSVRFQLDAARSFMDLPSGAATPFAAHGTQPEFVG